MKMMDKLTVWLASLLAGGRTADEKEQARIEYGLRIILEEGLKILVLILLFHGIHHEGYFYFSLLILWSTRTFAGGMHVNGTWNCLLWTILLFLTTSVLAPRAPAVSTGAFSLTGTACFLITLAKAPVRSIQRPIKEPKKRMQYKITAALSVALWTTILLSLKSTPYANCGFATLLLQSILLLPVKKPKE